MPNDQLLDRAVELQSIAQCALAYCRDPYDIERFERVRGISAEMIARLADMPFQQARDLFCSEKGYQTPKLDTRAAIFDQSRILLVSVMMPYAHPAAAANVKNAPISQSITRLYLLKYTFRFPSICRVSACFSP